MSIPNSSRSVSSTPNALVLDTPPPATPGNQRAPGVHALSEDSRASNLSNSASADHGLSLEDRAEAITGLSEALETRNRSAKPDLEQDIAIFTGMKALQAEIETALWLDRDAPALWDLRDALRPFLLRLATDFARPDRHDKTAEDLMQSLDQDDVHTLCNGLAVCASSWAGMLFGEADLKALRPALQLLTDRLLERAMQIGFPEDIGANGTTLDILNWVSRALKNGMVEASDDIRDAFALALPLLQDWIGVDRDDAASAAKAPYLTAYQLGKCAVQIDTMLKFALVSLDSGNRQLFADCIGALCRPRIRAHLTKRPVDSVTITGIGNLAKDLLEAGILKTDQAQHLATLAGAAQMMGCIPRTDLLAGDCRTLSNAGNFLRVLDEHAVPRLPGFGSHLRQWHAACDALIDCLASKAFAAAKPSAQAVSNLISFTKCRCKQLLKERDGTAADKLTPLRSAAACLAQQLMAHGSEAFHTMEAIGGLLSGVAHLLEAGMMPDTAALRALLAQVMVNLGRIRTRIENAQTRRTLLPALSGLLRMGAITLEETQPVLSRLLEPAASSSGRHTLQDLRRECEALGMEEEPVAASSATTSTASTPQADAADVPAALPPRPGYTRIVEVPRSEVSMPPGTTKSVASSVPYKPGGEWRQAQKTFRPGRLAPTLSRAPVLPTQVDDDEHEDEDEQAPGRGASDTRTMTTSNAATTTSRATQPVALLGSESRKGVAVAGACAEHVVDRGALSLQGNALLRAAEEGNVKGLERLLSAGVPADYATDHGGDALKLASRNGHLGIVQMLLRANAQVNRTDKKGFSALIFAATEGHAEVVDLLLSAGAEVDHPANDGKTPLMFASEHGHADVARRLLDAGAKLDQFTPAGHDAMEFAFLNRHQHIVDMFGEYWKRKSASSPSHRSPPPGD